jgi:hypothetical protein
VGVWIKGVALRLYADGMLAVENTNIPDLYIEDVPNYPTTIGTYHRGAPIQPDSFFNGTIDNVMVYDRALTVEEVETLYISPLLSSK